MPVPNDNEFPFQTFQPGKRNCLFKHSFNEPECVVLPGYLTEISGIVWQIFNSHSGLSVTFILLYSLLDPTCIIHDFLFTRIHQKKIEFLNPLIPNAKKHLTSPHNIPA